MPSDIKNSTCSFNIDHHRHCYIFISTAWYIAAPLNLLWRALDPSFFLCVRTSPELATLPFFGRRWGRLFVSWTFFGFYLQIFTQLKVFVACLAFALELKHSDLSFRAPKASVWGQKLIKRVRSPYCSKLRLQSLIWGDHSGSQQLRHFSNKAISYSTWIAAHRVLCTWRSFAERSWCTKTYRRRK